VSRLSSLVIFVIAIALGTFADEEQATLEVDALVNDDENEPVRPLGTPLAGQFFEQPRRSTPSIPPGFTAPAVRAIAGDVTVQGSRTGSHPMSRTASSTIIPAIPIVPVTPVKSEARTKKGKQAVKSVEVDAPAASASVVPATPTRATVKGNKSQDTTEASSKAADTSKKPEPKEKKAPETPAKAATKAKAKKVEKAEKSSEESASKLPPKDVTDANTTANAKRHPGKLDIPAAKVVEKEPVPATTPGHTKNARSIPAMKIPSVPASPAVAAAPSPIKHTAAPRTLRLVSTPKVETPNVAPPPLPQIPTVDKLRSRQASIASLNQPGTPASELISDTASMTSGMVSRASSPPPTIVGSAPVRKITKAQAKKNRQERKRTEEEKEKAEVGSDVEVVQAPIIGRKKKAKKPSSTPKPVAAMASAMKEAARSQPASPKSATVEDDPLEAPAVATVKAQSAHNSASATPEPEPQHEDVKERREPSAQSVLSDLQKSGELLMSQLEFFKPLSSSYLHSLRNTPSGQVTLPPDLKVHLSEADLDALADKDAVRLKGQDGKRDSYTLITPNGRFLWGLTAELEERALTLEHEIEKLASYLRFHPPPRAPRAPALKDAKSPSSDPALFAAEPPLPPLDHGPALATPADAAAYLNQFVLPATDSPPPAHPRPEMAAVGGMPAAGTALVQAPPGRGAHAACLEKAARSVVLGGRGGEAEIEGVAVVRGGDKGGVWVSGVEGLVGVGVGVGVGVDGCGSGRDRAAGRDRARDARDGRAVLGLEEAEAAMVGARREQEVLERKLGALLKRNRKVARC
ncbi:hypothetical protein C7974DRAFT_452975, partial [Boeremia exigua]|uniref:uncharacterized protein n=1 Tax=Boeremia exigua TaxID=749465 RepID=UPI001E8D4AE2